MARQANKVVVPVGLGKLDAPFVTTVEKALKQMCHVTAHLLGIGLDHGLDVRSFHRGARGKAGEPKPAGAFDQNGGSASGSAAGFAAGGGTCCAGLAVGAAPFHTSASSTGLASGRSSGRSNHFTISSFGR